MVLGLGPPLRFPLPCLPCCPCGRRFWLLLLFGRGGCCVFCWGEGGEAGQEAVRRGLAGEETPLLGDPPPPPAGAAAAAAKHRVYRQCRGAMRSVTWLH